MSIPEGYDVKYQQDLAGLIKTWAEFRKKKEKDALAQFYHACNDLSQEIPSFGLGPLHQVMGSMAESAEAGLDDKIDNKLLIKEIDWLMNQLIRGSHEPSDPFLNETRTTTDEAFLDQQFNSADVSAINSVAKPNIVIIDDQLSAAQSLANTLEDFGLNMSCFKSIDGFRKVQKEIEVDLVLLDIAMPNVTEQQVFDFAKELVLSSVKVISCSSTFTFESRLLAVRAEVSDYAVKPINTYVLVEKIGRALSLHQSNRYKIVIVDDQKAMGTFYKAILEQVGCDVLFFASAKELFNSLDDLMPNMFLLDMMMPDVDGLEVAQMIRQEHKFDFAPIIFITGDEQIENRLAAIDAGADDVISKSTAVNTITHQILTRLSRASKVSAFVAKDALTGVLNHSQIVERVNQTIRATQRRKSKATIALIDVDHFKRVNDTHGHVVGDKVLCALGQLLANSVRETDIVGRYGGEEFVIVFNDCNLQDAANKVQLIKDVFGTMKFSSNEAQFEVTFSAGVVDLNAFENVMPAIEAADKALYKAKSDGRNKVIKYKLSDIK
ncbi:MAG: diguanylate cyclase (GGDEF)-like protein [Patiriisocius sp.]|jgi:diguanylate cyclase (GGDEF)-like protein